MTKNKTKDSEWTHKGCFKIKECVVCGTKFKPFSGVHRFCSPQCKGKWKYITGAGSTENQYKYISGNWKKYFARLLQNRSYKKDGLIRNDLLEILKKQNYKCALSGIDLTCKLVKGKKTLTNASMDRIIAGDKYTKDNIQLVCVALNKWRGDTSLKEFISWCKLVAKYNN